VIWRRSKGVLQAHGLRDIYRLVRTSKNDKDAIQHKLLWTLWIGRSAFGAMRTHAEVRRWAERIERKRSRALSQ
jgi:hypothetical protein